MLVLLKARQISLVSISSLV